MIDLEVGMEVRVKQDLSITKNYYSLDDEGTMLGMRGKPHRILSTNIRTDGKTSIRLGTPSGSTFIFAPEDLEIINDSFEVDFKPKEYTFNPENLFIGESECQSKKRL